MYLRYFRLFRDSVLVMKGMAMIRGWVRDGPRSICQRIQVCSLGLTRGEYMLYGQVKYAAKSWVPHLSPHRRLLGNPKPSL